MSRWWSTRVSRPVRRPIRNCHTLGADFGRLEGEARVREVAHRVERLRLAGIAYGVVVALVLLARALG